MQSELAVGDPWRFSGTILVVDHDVDPDGKEAHGRVVEERPHPGNELFDGVTVSFSPRHLGFSLASLTMGEMVAINATVRDANGIEKHFIGSATAVKDPRESA